MSLLTQADNQETLARIESEAAAITAKSQEVVLIQNGEDERRATEFLAQIKLRLKEIDAAKAKLVKPIKDHVKQLEAEFKRVSAPLEQADELVRAAMTAYRSSDAFRAVQAEASRLQSQAVDAMRSGDMQSFQQLAEAHGQAVAEAPKKVETQSGEARFRKVTKWVIDDMDQLPAEYWLPNERKISEDVRRGLIPPGVRFWQEDVPVIV